MFAIVLQNLFQRALPVFLWMAVCGYAAITALSALAAPVDKFDDAIPLLHGTLVQQGRTPNLDFYSFYPPLSLYLNAAAFDLIGRSVIAARLLADLFYLGVLLLVVWFFSSRYRSSGPLIPAAVLLIAASIGELVTMPAVARVCPVARRAADVSGFPRPRALSTLGGRRFGRAHRAGPAVPHQLRRLRCSRRDAGSAAATCARQGPRAACSTRLGHGDARRVRGAGRGVCGRRVSGRVRTSCRHGSPEFVVTAQRLMALRGFVDLQPNWITHLPCAPSALVHTAPAALVLVSRPARQCRDPGPGIRASGGCLAASRGGASRENAFLCRVDRRGAGDRRRHSVPHVRSSSRTGRAQRPLVLLLLLHYFLSRADWHHFRVLPVVAAFLLPLLVMSGHEAGRAKFEHTTATGTAFAVLTVAILLFVLSDQFRPHVSRLPHGVTLLGDLVRDPHLTDTDRVLGPTPLPPHWALVYRDGWELQALRYVHARTRPSEPIFVGVANHSQVFWNDLRMYWLSDRPIGAKMFQLETRVATEAPVQQGIIADLERNQVMWIVLDTALEGDDVWLNTGKPAYEGSRLLDDYIAGRFAEEARFGPYMVLRRVK